MKRLLVIVAVVLCAPSRAAQVAATRDFADGFEDGTTNAWQQAEYRNRCQVVTSAVDGVTGPPSGRECLAAIFRLLASC